MSKYAPATWGLKHLQPLKDLASGEIYLVRFNNPLKNYRTDVWIGVIMPEDFGPRRHLNRRPVGAKPDEGPWTIPLKDRMYSVYLPGRNLFRWVGLNDLFMLNDKTPSAFSHAGARPDAKVLLDLYKIAKKNPGLQFWEDMADQEICAKGKRGRTLSLFLPEGREEILHDEHHGQSNSASNENEQARRSESADPAQPRSSQSAPRELDDGTQPPPAKVQAQSQSFSQSRQTKSIELQGVSGSSKNEEHTPFQAEAVSFLCFPQTGAAGVNGHVQPKVEGATGKAGPAAVGQENLSILELSLHLALEHVFLQKDGYADILAIFSDVVAVQKPEADQIRSFLTVREFAPRLVQVNNPPMSADTVAEDSGPNDSIMRHRIGDLCGIGSKYQLEGVIDSDDLCAKLLSLGRLYAQARRFRLTSLIRLVILKLQAAWNSYPGLHQLEPFLEITSLVFLGGTDPTDLYDDLQAWIVNFIAETMDLFLYRCPERFWQVMRGNQALIEQVFALRADVHRKDPEKYADPRVWIRSRGIDQF